MELNSYSQIYPKEGGLQKSYGYQILMYFGYEKYGFVINDIRNEQEWNLIKNDFGKTSRENKYSWVISYDYKGLINMMEWNLVINDIFKRKDIPNNHLTRLIIGLEHNFSWEIPKIKFEEYGNYE